MSSSIKCVKKAKYTESLSKTVAKHTSLHAYKCFRCRRWHVTHLQPIVAGEAVKELFNQCP